MPREASRTVLVIFHEEFLGGASLSILRVIPALRERGWRFVFWAPRPSALFDELQRRGLEAHGAPRPVGYSLRRLRLPPGTLRRVAGSPRYLGALASLIRRRRPGLVHANSLYSLAEALGASASGARVLLQVHELVPPGPKGALARWIAPWISSERIAVSAASAATLRRHPNDPVRVVFGGTQVPADPVPIRAEPEPFVVGTVGVVSPRKGTDVFVAAATEILARRRDISFKIIGAARDPVRPEWSQEVVRTARAAGIDYVESADVTARLREWDAFLLPSRTDPFPSAMLEAMALGLPVIGTRSGGMPEQVPPDGGVLVEPDDASALARAIVSVRELPVEERAAMGAAARNRVATRFTLEHQAAALDRAYRALLS